MPSLQESAPGGKAAKFVAANPLGPMADPFAGMGDDEKEYHKALSENINNRMMNAMEELKEKHRTGTNEIDDPDRAPTGAAYIAEAQRIREQKRMEENQRHLDMKQQADNLAALRKRDEDNDINANSGNDDHSDDEWDHLLDNDSELDQIRARRIEEMKQAQIKLAEQKSLGHGQLRTITQDEFLPECTGSSEWVAVHFFHNDFERCKIMDHHLKLIAPLHLTCKFLRIDAEKSPFFVQKLQIKTLPTLIVFREGKAIQRLTGFEGLAKDPNEPDKWHTGKLQQWLAGTGAIEYKVPTEELLEEMRMMGIKTKGGVWSGTSGSGFQSQTYESDDE
jgi:hypothetical protein